MAYTEEVIKIDKFKLYVYMFLGKNDEVIYVGKTNNLNTRFRSHQEDKPEMWDEHTKIVFNKFDNENNQSAYEKLMIMKYSPKYNGIDNYKSTIEIVDPMKDTWETFDELIPKNDCITVNNSSIKVSKRKLEVSSKFYETLWIRKEDKCIKISGNGTLKLDEREFSDLIDEMITLLENGIYIESDTITRIRNNKKNKNDYSLSELRMLRERTIARKNSEVN